MITVEHLTKCYGDFMAVSDLSFEIDEGHVYGFLGPNGAGKSPTMNIMAGCLSATEGKGIIDGHDIFEEPEKAKKLIGYLPEQPPLYMNETPVEYLKFVGAAKGLKGRELQRQVEEVIGQVRIDEVKNRLISKLSKGYRQRVGIAQALLGNPKVIILDEPTVGLDPIQIIEIRDLIKELGQTHTVILSSHILSEVQAVCGKVLIIARGKLAAFDEPENLEKLMLASNGITFTAEATGEDAARILSAMKSVTEWTFEDKGDGTVEIHAKTEDSNSRDICRRLFFAFAAEGKAILSMTSKKANLEDVFIELTEGESGVERSGDREEQDIPAVADDAGNTQDFRKTEDSGSAEDSGNAENSGNMQEAGNAENSGSDSAESEGTDE